MQLNAMGLGRYPARRAAAQQAQQALTFMLPAAAWTLIRPLTWTTLINGAYWGAAARCRALPSRQRPPHARRCLPASSPVLWPSFWPATSWHPSSREQAAKRLPGTM